MYRPRTNRERLTGSEKYAQKKASKHGVDEVVFSKESREEYLTGFHKRKLQRQKKAQEYIKEQERLARVEERKKIREEKRKDLETQLQSLKDTVSEVSAIRDEVENEDDNDNSVGEGEWDGFTDTASERKRSKIASEDSTGQSVEEREKNGLLKQKEVYDVSGIAGDATTLSLQEGPEDVTTVTIESLDSPAFASTKEMNIAQIAKANNVNLDKSDEILEESIKRAKKYAVVCGVAKPKQKEKGSKKKFRYLTKAERRENTRKEKMKKKKPRA